MSETSPEVQPSNVSIALFSMGSNLQAGLLSKLISEEIKQPCQAYKLLSKVPADVTLLLIDCASQHINDLKKVVKFGNSQNTNITVALFNAEFESDHESLLDWPCVSGIFYDDTNQEQLIRGLARLLDGDYWVPRRLLHRFLDKNRRTPTSNSSVNVNLTKRERQILKLIKEGATNGDIATALDVSEHTVKSHLYNVYKKIGVRNRLEAGNWVRDLDDFDEF